jgi:hypothetical protein
MNIARIRLAFVLLVTFGVLGGCSSFNQQWNARRKELQPVHPLAGLWTGTWQSDKSDHGGSLRAIVTPGEEEGKYEAWYFATYGGVLTFDYKVNMTASADDRRMTFEGEADLGAAGGVYQYKGHADGAVFFSTYTSSGDHGTFKMTRPK